MIRLLKPPRAPAIHRASGARYEDHDSGHPGRARRHRLDSDRVHDGERPRGQRLRRQPGAAGWSRDRGDERLSRPERQAPGAGAGARARHGAVRGAFESRQSRQAPASASISRSSREPQQTRVALQPFDVRTAADFGPAFAGISRMRPDALITLSETVTWIQRQEIADFALKHRLPTAFNLGGTWRPGG
jgi:hypothetical protein